MLGEVGYRVAEVVQEQVPAYTLTGTASDIAVQRILVRLGVSRTWPPCSWTTSATR